MAETSNKEIIKEIIHELLSCEDGRYITEIYADHGSDLEDNQDNHNGWVRLMIETDPHFSNNDLYDRMNDLDEKIYPFRLILSVEPDMVERGHGIILWKAGSFYI